MSGRDRRPPDGGAADPDAGAAALRWDGSGAPLVVAAGRGWLADEIRRIAREAGVPEWADESLARALVRIPVGQQIPPALFAAVAQVIAFAWQTAREHRPPADDVPAPAPAPDRRTQPP